MRSARLPPRTTGGGKAGDGVVIRVMTVPIGHTALAIVLGVLMYPSLSDVRNIADNARGGVSREKSHHCFLHSYRFVDRRTPMLHIGHYVAEIEVVRQDPGLAVQC